MQVRALTLFLELVQSRSIRQVSQRLDMQPTAVIRLIDQLEHYFGNTLVERGGGGIRLTEAGQALAERIPGIVAELRAARALVEDIRQLERGHIVIHAGGSVIAELLAPVICDVHMRFPNLRFTIEITSAPSITEAVAEGTADLGITIFTPETGRSLISHAIPVAHAAFVAAAHPLASEPRVSFNRLLRETLAIPDERFGVRRRLESAARRYQVALSPTFSTASLDMQKELALRGRAVLILPHFCLSRERSAGALIAIPLSGDCGLETTLDVTVQPNRPLPFATRIVLDAVKSALAESVEWRKSITS